MGEIDANTVQALRELRARMAAAEVDADDVAVARHDASYVLDWLRATNAPANILRLQTRVVGALGGYVEPEIRMGLK